MNKENKRKIVESMKNIEQAILDGDVACLFMYEQELSKLTSEEFSGGFTSDFVKANAGKGNVFIDEILMVGEK